MRTCFAIIYILFSLQLNAQNDLFRTGIDSTRQITWKEFDFGEHYIVRGELTMNQPDAIVILNCDSSLYMFQADNHPESCMEAYQKNKSNGLDSLGWWYLKCIQDYYINEADKYRIDTVWIADEYTIADKKIVGFSEWELNFLMTKYELISPDRTSRITSEFYTLEEIKGVCVDTYFRNKSVEAWENGKKHDKWKYWDISGKLVKEIVYKHGVLIKETNY